MRKVMIDAGDWPEFREPAPDHFRGIRLAMAEWALARSEAYRKLLRSVRTPEVRQRMDRNRAIIAAVEAGERMVDVARRYGLSRGRVTQICVKERRTEAYRQSVTRLDLPLPSCRALNAMEAKYGCRDLDTLMAYVRRDGVDGLLEVPNCGRTTAREIAIWAGIAPAQP